MYAGTNIIDKLSVLTKEKQLLFGLLGTERFFICYKTFNRRVGFGNVVHLLEAMSLIERVIFGEKVDVQLVNKYKDLVDESTPDMDDFGSINGSLALNVTVMIYEALNLITNSEKRILKDISTMCTDSIDFLILEIEDDYNDRDFEKISNHSLMKEELSFQNGIVHYLEEIPEVEIGDIQTLRQMQSESEFSRLNLEEIFAQ